MQANLRRLISEHRLEDLSERIVSAASPAIAVIKQPPGVDFIGASRLGGHPDVPGDFVWPRRSGQPLGLLAQLNCAEIAGSDAGNEHALPGAGLLHFFYDLEEHPWGFDPKDKGGAVVVHSNAQGLARAAAPPDLNPNSILTAVPVGFRRILTLPTDGAAAYEALGIPECQIDDYFGLVEALAKANFDGPACHQLLGHSMNVQGDMQLECQWASSGLNLSRASAYRDPKGIELAPGAAEWRLLLQLDSDDELNVMWGDCGMIYFWIRDCDLQQRRWDGTWTILQSL